MKVVIRKRFRDIETGNLKFPGEQAEFSLDRARKLARSGFVQLLEDEPVVEDPVEPKVEKEEVEVPEKPEVGHTPKNEKGKRGRKPNK